MKLSTTLTVFLAGVLFIQVFDAATVRSAREAETKPEDENKFNEWKEKFNDWVKSFQHRQRRESEPQDSSSASNTPQKTDNNIPFNFANIFHSFTDQFHRRNRRAPWYQDLAPNFSASELTESFDDFAKKVKREAGNEEPTDTPQKEQENTDPFGFGGIFSNFVKTYLVRHQRDIYDWIQNSTASFVPQEFTRFSDLFRSRSKRQAQEDNSQKQTAQKNPLEQAFNFFQNIQDPWSLFGRHRRDTDKQPNPFQWFQEAANNFNYQDIVNKISEFQNRSRRQAENSSQTDDKKQTQNNPFNQFSQLTDFFQNIPHTIPFFSRQRRQTENQTTPWNWFQQTAYNFIPQDYVDRIKEFTKPRSRRDATSEAPEPQRNQFSFDDGIEQAKNFFNSLPKPWDVFGRHRRQSEDQNKFFQWIQDTVNNFNAEEFKKRISEARQSFSERFNTGK